MKRPKFDKTETDPTNTELREQAKTLNKLIHKLNKTKTERERLKDLIEKYKGKRNE